MMVSTRWFVLLAMIFCHVVDDYYLQGILASMKQKDWWRKNAPQELYRCDWIPAILAHAFSWSFCIMLPIVIYSKFDLTLAFYILFIMNVAVHATVDNAKCNKHEINLVLDQTLHLIQIICTWGALVLFG